MTVHGQRVPGAASRSNRTRGSRTGIALVAVLLCLLVIMLFSAAVMRSMSLQSRASRDDEAGLQALYLMEAAAARARARIDADPKYVGEEWKMALPRFAGTQSAAAVIRVETVTDQARQRQIIVQVQYPDGEVHRAQRSLEFAVTLPESQSPNPLPPSAEGTPGENS